MINIYIGHKKRQGKDTFANMLKEELGDEATIISFAEPIKHIVADALNISVDTLEEWKNNGVKLRNEDHTVDARDILINFGNGKMKEYFSKFVWADLAIKRAKESGCKYIIISDFRFKEEYINSITNKDIEQTITVKVERDKNPPDNEADKNLQDFVFDRVIENAGTLEELRTKAKKFANNITQKNGQELKHMLLSRKNIYRI